MTRLAELERELSLAFRKQFVGEVEWVIVEGQATGPKARSGSTESESPDTSPIHHGRSDRHFEIFFESANAKPGDLIPIRIDRVTPTRTHGTRLASTSTNRDVPLPVCRHAVPVP